MAKVKNIDNHLYKKYYQKTKAEQTQKGAILSLFKEGKTLDWCTAFKLTGSQTMRNRVIEFEKIGYVFVRNKIKFKTKYKTSGAYMTYKLDIKMTPKKLLK